MNATAEQFALTHFLSDSNMTCVEIGLTEIEHAAGINAALIHISDITDITQKALLKRPEHAADILLVSSWLLAETLCTQAQRDVVRSYFLNVAKSIEYSLS